MGKMTNREILDLFSQLESIRKEKANLEQKELYIKSTLAASIPPGGSKAGVSHTVRLGHSVSWAKAASRIISELVPKTKTAEANAIVAQNTAETQAHIFKMES